MYGNPETTPGGRALKFYSSVRLSISRKEAIWEGTKENIIGHSIDLRCVKNGGGIPFRRTQINLIYPGKGRAPGFDKVDNLIEFASGRGVFEMKGSWYWYDLGNVEMKKVKDKLEPVLKDGKPVPIGPEKIANGMDNLKLYLASHPEVIDRVRKDVVALIKKEETQPVVCGSQCLTIVERCTLTPGRCRSPGGAPSLLDTAIACQGRAALRGPDKGFFR